MSQIDASSIKTSQLRALIAVARHGSFKQASVALGINQSSVSYSIAALEETLGVTLLHRSYTGAALTAIGEDILSDAKSATNAIQRMATKAAASSGQNSDG